MTETNDNNDPTFPRSRVKKQSNRVLYLFIITISLLTGGFYFYQKNLKNLQDASESGIEITSQESKSNSTSETNVSPLTSSGPQPQIEGSLKLVPSTNSSTLEPSSANSDDLSGEHAIKDNSPLDGATPSSAQELSNTDYKQQIVELNTFYDHLDSQQYMQDFRLPAASKTHFSKLIQKLIENPPIVTRETDDLFTLLKNTAHFFRIIGKDNILVLKGILDREKDSFESILQTLYSLTDQPEMLKEEYSVTLDQDSLYDYACFFLNTMGGRLYLFRRDSNSRMAVSFYAIAIIDRANDSGNSRHGIDIRPGIDSLIEEIENGGKNLRMREFYLDTLYDLKVKYD